MVKNKDLVISYWTEFMDYLKSYAEELRGDTTLTYTTNSETFPAASKYPEIREIVPAIIRNSSGLVGLIIFAYIKKDKKLMIELLKYSVINFGYIKVMKVVSENLLRFIELEDGMNNIQFQDELIKLYFMRIS